MDLFDLSKKNIVVRKSIENLIKNVRSRTLGFRSVRGKFSADERSFVYGRSRSFEIYGADLSSQVRFFQAMTNLVS